MLVWVRERMNCIIDKSRLGKPKRNFFNEDHINQYPIICSHLVLELTPGCHQM